MKTIEYNLLSFPGESLQLPKEAVNIGNDFIEKIKKSKNMSDLFKRINEYPALRFIASQRGQLLRRANYVMVAKAESPRKKSFIDHIYLDLGSYYACRDGETKENSEMNNEIDTFHSRLYNDKFN